MKRPALPPGSAPSRVRRAVLSCLMIWGLAPLPAYLGAQADNPDSLVRLLTSPSVGVRADAVVRLSLIPMAQLPVAARPALVSLLEREATGQVAYPDTTARYETYGEYIIDLTRTVLRFHDPASVGASVCSASKRVALLRSSWQASARRVLRRSTRHGRRSAALVPPCSSRSAACSRRSR